jgi:tetratricopeptide (TPR) repeat protein
MSQRIISQISQLFAAGRFAEAEKLCLSAAQTSPGDSMIPAFRGAIRLELGDIKSAVVFLSKAISVDPGNATAHFNLGVAHKKLMQLEAAIASFRTALGLAGPTPVILTAIGLTELARGRSAEAAMILEQAARKDVRSPLAFLNWGEALKSDRQYDKAIAAFKRALALQPDHVDALNSLGAVYAELEKTGEAEQHFRQALSLNPKHVMTRNNFGVLLKNKGLLAEALSEFEAANAADPNYAMAFFNAGTVLKELQKPAAALTALQRAVKLRPDLAEAHLAIGGIHFDDDSFNDAAAALTRAIKINPGYIDAHVMLGALYRKLRNWKEARASYDRVLAVDPQHFEALLGLGQTFSGQGLFIAADECFRRALDRQPDAPVARLALAKALLDQSKLDEAESCCRAVLEVIPHNGEAHLTLADILSRQWRDSEALPEYRRAMDLMPASMRPIVRLAECLQKLGRTKELADVVDRLATSAADAKSDILRIKILSSIAEISGDARSYEEALEVARAAKRIADVSFLPLLRPTMHFDSAQAASLLAKMEGMEQVSNHRAAFYRARSLLLHELGSYRSAWQDLMRANQLVLASGEIEPEQMRDYRPGQVDQLRNASWALNDLQPVEHSRPVFILGVSRSGKSTLARLLSLCEAWTDLDEYSILDESLRSLKIARDEPEKGLDPEQSGDLAAHFLQRCKTFAERGTLSFTAPGHIRSAKLLAETVPGVRFIFIRRNKFDVAFRCLQKLYRKGNYYSYNVRECMSYIDWYNAMTDELAPRLGERARSVTYEELVANPPAVTSSLWQWLELEPPGQADFSISSDIGCSEPYRDLIAAELE